MKELPQSVHVRLLSWKSMCGSLSNRLWEGSGTPKGGHDDGLGIARESIAARGPDASPLSSAGIGRNRRARAAGPARDHLPVRARGRVAEEGADRVGDRGREDVLEIARLLFDLGLVHLEGLGEEGLGEAVPPDQVLGALVAGRGELRLAALVEDAVGPHALEQGRRREARPAGARLVSG